MSLTTREIRERIEELEEEKAKQQQAKGAAQRIREEMQKEFGVDTMEGANKLLRKMDRERQKLEDRLKRLEQEVNDRLE